MFKKSFALLFGLALLLGASSTVFASGFAIVEQSVSGLGTAFASGAAAADASTIFYNPAGITLLEGQQITGGMHVIFPSAKLSATTAENTPLGGSVSLGDNNSGNGGVTKLVPNLYYTNKLNDKLSIGLGINAPFGLATKYDKDWVGRYHAVESDVMTINFNPALAYKVTDKLSLGFGLNAEYIDVTLSSMVDAGLLLSMGTSTDTDVFAENTADDWGFGFNLGALYELSPGTRIGVAYRSEIKHKLGGEVDFDVPVGVPSAYFPDQDISGTITLPATASVNFFHQLNEKWAVMADVTWTDWSSFDKLTINFDGGGILGGTVNSSTTTEKWEDTWRYSVGATYQATEALLIRTGLAYDETPIPDDYRTPRIPGEDRFWVTLGVGYQLSESLSLDAAYAHLFVKDSKIQKYAGTDPTGEDFARGTLVGEFENSVDIASIQINYKF
jgi:long-chain fatty acid transport protein